MSPAGDHDAAERDAVLPGVRDAAPAGQCDLGAGAVNPEFRQLEDNPALATARFYEELEASYREPRSVRDHVVGAVVFIVLAGLFLLVARWRGLTC